jgi:alpha-galactosidase
MKFLLWFEPERAIWGTPLTQEHPEWFLGTKEKNKSVLFNMGDKAARRWMTDYISGLIEQHGVDCYRQDFNFYCLSYWRDNDAPDRQGMTEIRHVEGLYAYWDELCRRHPGLLIDNCASGGRRLDLEAISRCVPLTRSDHQCAPDNDPIGGQVQIMGLSRWLPLHGTGGSHHPGDTYFARSNYGTSLGMGFGGYEYTPLDNVPWEWFAKMTTEFLRARPLLLGDFYPLAGSTNDPTAWAAFQSHRDDLQQGLILALRRDESPFRTACFQLEGLDEQATYELEDADTAAKTRHSGRDLAAGLEMTIEKPHDSRLIFYQRV